MAHIEVLSCAHLMHDSSRLAKLTAKHRSKNKDLLCAANINFSVVRIFKRKLLLHVSDDRQQLSMTKLLSKWLKAVLEQAC